MIETVMSLHKCETCSIRRRATANPDSIFARFHRWHLIWWPGWKIHQAHLRARATCGTAS